MAELARTSSYALSLFVPAAEAPPPDLFSIGIVLAIVGGFLLANSILFRHPRTLVADFFGQRERRLASIREYIFHRVQVHLGFLLLLGGFGLQLIGYFQAGAVSDAPREFPTFWVGGIALAVLVLELAGWWGSRLLFRRYVREHFLQHPPNLERDLSLLREVGELFGIPSEGDESVPSYVLRIRQRLGVPGPSANPGRPMIGLDEAEAEEELGLSS